MDFRLPGLDGARATAAVRGRAPGAAVLCLTAEATDDEREAVLAAGAVGWVEKGGPIESSSQAIRRDRARGAAVNLTPRTPRSCSTRRPTSRTRASGSRTCGSSRSTSTSARRASATTSTSAPHDFYDRLRAAPALPTTSQPTPQDFVDAYEQLAGYERIYSLQLSAKLSGTYQSAALPPRTRGRPGPRRRHRDGLARGGLLALAIQRRLARGTTDEEIEALIERFKEENGVVFTVATLEYLQKGGRIGRAQALAGTLLNVKPILSIDDGVVHPIGKVRGRQKALEEFAPRLHRRRPRTGRASRRDRPRGCAGVDRRAHRPGGRRARRRRSSSSRLSAPSSARTPGPAPSASLVPGHDRPPRSRPLVVAVAVAVRGVAPP